MNFANDLDKLNELSCAKGNSTSLVSYIIPANTNL